MSSVGIQQLIAMVLYMSLIIGIGFFYAKRASKSSEEYFLGGRTIGPWVTAFSAEASDMSGYLLMGIPGLAYWSGLAEASWTCIGLALGTYANFLIVSKRLRRYSIVVDAFTLPDFFSKRFREKKKTLMLISSLIIVVFFCIYAAQCLSACGKLFANVFGASYRTMMIVSALFVLLYTFLGGFLAESVSDFMQAIIMIGVLILVMVLAATHAGGMGEILKHVKGIDGFFSLTKTASPIEGQADAFGAAKSFGFLPIVSTLAWGLGYFGMPQILLRFMAIRSERELVDSRRIASIWVIISMFSAIFIGFAGRAISDIIYTSNIASENIFIDIAGKYLPSFLAGVAASGILAASISSSDSYLLISASALSQSIYRNILKKNASEKEVLNISRLMLCLITIVAAAIAWNSNSTIFGITAFAWAGFGASFGPVILFSLFYKKTTHQAALAGMIIGGASVFVWRLFIKPLGGIWGVYELLPCFIIASLVILLVSNITKDPNEAQLSADFEKAKKGELGKA